MSNYAKRAEDKRWEYGGGGGDSGTMSETIDDMARDLVANDDRIAELEAYTKRMQIYVLEVDERSDKLEAQIKPDCTWTEPSDWEYGGWETTCGEEWAFTEGDPEENRVTFCQGCGGKVIIKALEQDDE